MTDRNFDLGKVAEARSYESISGAAEEEVEFGQGVIAGDDPEKQFKAFDGDDTTTFKGFALFTNSGDIDELKFDAEDPMRVLRKGVITTKISDDAGETIEAGDKVAVDENGWVTSKSEAEARSDGTDNAAVLSGSEFVTGGEAGDKVKVEINLPCDVEFVDLSA